MHNRVTEQARREIDALRRAAEGGAHVRTADLRRLSGKLLRETGRPPVEDVFRWCGELLEERTWEGGVIAFDWAFRMKRHYTPDTYPLFYGWLKEYVRGWGDCDDFCTHAFGELLRQEKSLFSHVCEWTNDDDFWVRRAAAVILIPAILHHDFEGLDPFLISDRLIQDPHELVVKGYGWMLKCLSQVDPQAVEGYLVKHRARMPRTAYRYALEKFDPETRARLMHR